MQKPELKINFKKEVHDEIMFYVNASNFEVSGLGNVTYNPEKKFFEVVSICLLKQENTPAHTEIDADAVCSAMYQLRDAPGSLNFWWHSHVNMGCFWSSEDMDTIKELGDNGWILATVFNKKNEHRSAFWTGGECSFSQLPVFIDEIPSHVADSRFKDWQENYESKVTNVTYKAPKRTYQSQKNYSGYGSYGSYADDYWPYGGGYVKAGKKNHGNHTEGMSKLSADKLLEAMKAKSAKDRPKGMSKTAYVGFKSGDYSHPTLDMELCNLFDYYDIEEMEEIIKATSRPKGVDVNDWLLIKKYSDTPIENTKKTSEGIHPETFEFLTECHFTEHQVTQMINLDLKEEEMIELADSGIPADEVLGCLNSGWTPQDIVIYSEKYGSTQERDYQ